MTMTRTESSTGSRPVAASIRVAQVLLIGPLGVLQVSAAVVFSITLGLDSARDWAVACWAVGIGLCCVVTGVRIPNSRRWRGAALALLLGQTAFSAVKLTVYHESASLVFFGFIALAVTLLLIPPTRGSERGSGLA